MKTTFKIMIFLTVISFLVAALSGCKSAPELTETPAAIDDSTVGETTPPTNTPRPAPVRPTSTPQPTDIPDTATPPPTPPPTETPTEAIKVEVETTPAVESESTATITAVPTTAARALPQSPQILATNALELVPNVDPGPPFSVEVSANHLLEGYRHRVSGIIRNNSDETYTGLDIIATFFMNNGKRYGPIRSNIQCLFLPPGATCPFIVEATSKNLSGVILHVTGNPTPRTPLSPEYSGVRYTIDNIGYVHIYGTVRNQYTVPARHITIVGSLINAQGEIVNVGGTILLAPVAPGNVSSFEISMKYAPFRSINITTQAEP